MLYLGLKLCHILSATLVFGSGICLAILGTWVFGSGKPALINQIGPLILKVEFWLTVSAAAVLLSTGVAMAMLAGFPVSGTWLAWALLLLVIAAVCWLAGLRLQHSMLNLARQSVEQDKALPEKYTSQLSRWMLLGLPSTLAMTGIFYLMVFKPTL